MSKFSGKAGTIYIEKHDVADGDGHQYEAWFEDFCILGTGASEYEALINASEHITNIRQILSDAIVATAASSAGGG